MLSDAICRRFIKDSANTDDPKVRLAYGRLAGIVGIACNLLLCGGKLLAGILAGSLAMIADAINNQLEPTVGCKEKKKRKATIQPPRPCKKNNTVLQTKHGVPLQTPR